MAVKEINLVQLYKYSTGVYHSKDERFKIEKIDNKWSWFLKSGSAWIAKDKRKYKTKSHCEKCIGLEMDNLYDDSELWER